MHSVALDKAYHMICLDQTSGRGKCAKFDRLYVQSTCTAYMYSLHVQPTCTAHMYSLHVQPTCLHAQPCVLYLLQALLYT